MNPEEKGKEYRAAWYKDRNHEMVFSWDVLSEETKKLWIKEAAKK